MQIELVEKTKNIPIEWNYNGVVSLVADNNYDFLTALYEIIDNAYAANATSVRIEIFTDSENNVTKITATDNGTPNSVLQLIGSLHSAGLTHGVLVCDGYSDQTT